MLSGDVAVLISEIRDVLQIVASLVVILLGLAAWSSLRAGRLGNRVQLDVDMQSLDVGGGELVGEMTVVLQNLGPRPQTLFNLFVEVRPSRHAGSGNGILVPATNMVTDEDFPLELAPGVRQVLSWTFEIPRDERLLRATAVINCDKWLPPDLVTSLSQKNFDLFGPTVRYTSRVFEVSPSAFRRF